MKRMLRYLGWMAIAAGALAVVFWAARVASRTPGGLGILRDNLVAGLPPILVNKQNPETRVWFKAKQRLLDEADRIEAASNSTADNCMGLAWLLWGVGVRISPDPAIVGRLIWCCPPKTPIAADADDVDQTLVTVRSAIGCQSDEHRARACRLVAAASAADDL